MTVQIEGWNVIDQDAAILWREYPFAKGAYATTLVFRGADGLVVVSPGTKLEARAYDALADFGKVRALIANNTYHHMGQKPWRERFPEAESYCPPGAVAALDKKVPGVRFRPLSDLALPSSVRWEDAPGFKTGETILRVDAKPGPVWYAGDLLANIQRTPGPPLKWLFTLTNSAPGFRLFKLATWLIVKDKKAVREWMLARLDEQPPAVVVPAHGPAFQASDVAERARAQIRRL
jgi:glyoxylase-like metal-dependent hydrolase (beta-lactamase superfamily II)